MMATRTVIVPFNQKRELSRRLSRTGAGSAHGECKVRAEAGRLGGSWCDGNGTRLVAIGRCPYSHPEPSLRDQRDWLATCIEREGGVPPQEETPCTKNAAKPPR